MTTRKDTPAADIADREIVSTRVLNAPRERVWKAWTDPQHLAQRWGPKGFTNTFREFDLRSGGIWRFVMHGPDGTDYQNKSVFVEVVKPERIVFDHVSGPQFQVVATFAEQAGKTRLTYRMIFKSAAECGKVKGVAVDANEQNFDRLEAQLAKMVWSANQNAVAEGRALSRPPGKRPRRSVALQSKIDFVGRS